jgi:methyl-accepting chemotaxis protein
MTSKFRIPFVLHLIFDGITVVLFIAVLAGTGVKQFADAVKENTMLRAHSSAVSKLENILTEARLMALESCLIANTSGTPPDPQVSMKKVKQMAADIDRNFTLLAQSPLTKKMGEEAGLKQLQTALQAYLSASQKTYESLNEGEVLDASANETEAAAVSFQKALKLADGAINKTLVGFSASIQARNDSTRKRLYSVGGAALLFSILGGFLLYHFARADIYKPIQSMVGRLADSAQGVNNAANSITSGSGSLAEDASRQASGLEEISATVEELTSMSTNNAENADHANKTAKETLVAIEKAISAMNNLTTAMQEIAAASEETSKINKTINEIAFQTNLLALNAAVEAARAGEAGAGFAVVAEEVRNLAIRSAEAANNTSQLIEDTVRKVNGGAEVVAQTKEIFDKVVVGVQKSGQLSEEIYQASNEQATGVKQINSAVGEIDQVTQQNAANAEEFSATALEMAGQSEMLDGILHDLIRRVGNKEQKRQFLSQENSAPRQEQSAINNQNLLAS